MAHFSPFLLPLPLPPAAASPPPPLPLLVLPFASPLLCISHVFISIVLLSYHPCTLPPELSCSSHKSRMDFCKAEGYHCAALATRTVNIFSDMRARSLWFEEPSSVPNKFWPEGEKCLYLSQVLNQNLSFLFQSLGNNYDLIPRVREECAIRICFRGRNLHLEQDVCFNTLSRHCCRG